MTSIEQTLKLSALPRLESRMLLQHIAPEWTQAYQLAHPEQTLSPAQDAQFWQLAERRLAGEPMAYVLGQREFYGRPFQVSPAVLIPRPETEHLIEAALNHGPSDTAQVLDLGTGSGAIALTVALERPLWHVTAVELSPAALTVAQHNAQTLGANVQFYLGSWYQALPAESGQQFDLILANPPYIEEHDPHLQQGDVRYEPALALSDGADGLTCLHDIIAAAPQYLKPSAWLILEHGYNQGPAVRQLCQQASLQAIRTLPDLAGLDRITLAQRESHSFHV